MAGARDLIGNCENCVSDEKPTKSVSVSCWNGVNKLNPHILNLNNDTERCPQRCKYCDEIRSRSDFQ